VIVMRMVTLVLRLTPYGVFALMAQVVASSSLHRHPEPDRFVLASYSALILMFCVHLLIVSGAGLNPLRYVKKDPAGADLRLHLAHQRRRHPDERADPDPRLGTPEGIANFAASFGATIGQNGCAGIYPAMLAVMIAPTVGIDPFTLASSRRCWPSSPSARWAWPGSAAAPPSPR
jgi:L-cystine uptake protein TcyP (sodium:dicarboxylate symporter family)